jgi:threonine dehydratase
MIQKTEIKEAAKGLSSFVHRTPVFTSSYINEWMGCEIFFKAENLQKTGSFKARGAMNSLLQLSHEQRQSGVATHSSGNHGQALAWAAASLGIPAYIVMPENAPEVKVAAVKSYGARVRFCAPNLQAREDGLAEVIDDTGAVFIPPYNYENTIMGQATCALEIYEEWNEIDFVLAPVGGGGLLSGTALSTSYFSPGTRVVGCEPVQADDAWRSFHEGRIVPSVNPDTVADGLRTSLGDITFAYIRELVSDILTCKEESIIEAMRIIWERMKLVIEPSAAVPLACMMENPSRFRGKRVALILSGGNVDLNNSPLQKA